MIFLFSRWWRKWGRGGTLPRHRDSKTKKPRHRDAKTKKTRHRDSGTKTPRHREIKTNKLRHRDSKGFFQRVKSHDIEIPRLKNHDIEIPRPKSHVIEFLWNSVLYTPWYRRLVHIPATNKSSFTCRFYRYPLLKFSRTGNHR